MIGIYISSNHKTFLNHATVSHAAAFQLRDAM